MASLIERRKMMANISGDWLYPQTRAAIRDAFGVSDGTAVINATNAYLNYIASVDKTKAQALAAFVNEDPMMVCSLGLEPQGVTMPIRWLNNQGAAYINTGIVPTIYNYIECQYRFNAFAHTGFLFGSVNTNDWTGFSMVHYGGAPMYINYAGADMSLGYSSVVGEIYNVTYNCAEVYVNGVKRSDRVHGSYTFQYPFFVYSRDTAGSPNRTANVQYSRFKLYEEYGGVLQRAFLPFIRQGANGMIDTLTGTFYPNANSSGSFTIEYTLPDGTPWTPANQIP